MQDRGLAAYVAELVGTFFLVFIITSVVTLYVATGQQAQFGSDFAVVGLAQGFVLFALVLLLVNVSNAHLNPAVTVAAAALRRIDPVDAVVYILAQLSGGVLGALLTKGLLLDEGRAGHYGAVQVTPLLAGNFAGFVVEALGTFLLVLAYIALVVNRDDERTPWGPIGVGLTLAFLVMVFAPLTGGAFNPARWFGPGLIGTEFGGVWPYLVGDILGGLLAAGFFVFVLAGGGGSAGAGAGAPGASRPGPTRS